MRSDSNAKPVVLSEHQHYFVVNDAHIPTSSKENIVLKPSGLAIIAQHYFQKYGIVIRICGESLKIQMIADKIHAYLSTAKKDFPKINKMGFIFISDNDPDDIFGHALPIIWEKNHGEEHLFFLDTTQYLAATHFNPNTFCFSKGFEDVVAFRKKLLCLQPNLKLWGMFGCRQIDYSSCYTDALVMLRDGLRMSSMKDGVNAKVKEVVPGDITVFYAPEQLLRTAQIGSYPVKKAQADLSCVIRLCCDGSDTKTETLEQFRNRFSESVSVKEEVKQFGTFTLFKAKQYAIDIERQKLAESLVSSVLRLS